MKREQHLSAGSAATAKNVLEAAKGNRATAIKMAKDTRNLTSLDRWDYWCDVVAILERGTR
jgi:hypothetical protein